MNEAYRLYCYNVALRQKAPTATYRIKPAQSNSGALLNEPVFDGQSRYTGKFTLVMGYHDEIEGSGMGRDKQVVMADGLADVMQMGADFRVMMVNRFFQRQNCHGG